MFETTNQHSIVHVFLVGIWDESSEMFRPGPD